MSRSRLLGEVGRRGGSKAGDAIDDVTSGFAIWWSFFNYRSRLSPSSWGMACLQDCNESL